jgi:hypothetical protein
MGEGKKLKLKNPKTLFSSNILHKKLVTPCEKKVGKKIKHPNN